MGFVLLDGKLCKMRWKASCVHLHVPMTTPLEALNVQQCNLSKSIWHCVVKALERIVAVLAAVGLRAAPKVFDRVELGMELGE